MKGRYDSTIAETVVQHLHPYRKMRSFMIPMRIR